MIDLVKQSVHERRTNRSVDDPTAIVAVTALGVVGSIVFLLLPMMVGALNSQ